ncbi:MAG: UDP-N-acetylmuramoyl-tripeptide--D-alanyl-D-alanine ligase [Phycisphaerae bacterium]|nr:UDP-N-acetylmuramoyl-tripeptide--D-alanyl-D-alanine ligase [Phycisphaerae bacterium]
MRALTGNEIRQAVRGRWLSRQEPIPVRGVSIDSRTAARDDLFVAVAGDKFDGHDFLEAAASRGCVAAIVDIKRQIAPEIMARFPAGVIGVEDTRAALLDLAGYYRSVLAATVVGITGSNGKTTVKEMVHHILSRRLTGTASPQSYNNEIGMPLTLFQAGAGDDYIVAEVGTNAPGEVVNLSRALRPNIAVITSITEAHLERLESIERIAAEKASLLSWLGERDIAVVNADSEALEHALKSYNRRMIRFGESPEAQLRMTGFKSNGKTQKFQINDRDWVTMPIPGRHNALNALAAIAVCARFGFDQEECGEALADFTGLEMRLQTMEIGDIQLINDCYNANPASMLAAAAVLSDCKAKRRVFVAGDMLELGPKAQAIHADLGKAIASRRVDLIIGVGRLGRLVAESAAERGKKTAAFSSFAEAAEGIAPLIMAGDVVLLKGSRAMGMEKLIPTLTAGKNHDKASPAKKPGGKKATRAKGTSA